MPEQEPPGRTGEAAAAAFARVLEAERTAEAAVAACVDEAARRRAQAQAEGEALSADIESRLVAWRRRRALAVAREIAECDRQAALLAAPCPPDAAQEAAIARAAARLADELISGD